MYVTLYQRSWAGQQHPALCSGFMASPLSILLIRISKADADGCLPVNSVVKHQFNRLKNSIIFPKRNKNGMVGGKKKDTFSIPNEFS